MLTYGIRINRRRPSVTSYGGLVPRKSRLKWGCMIGIVYNPKTNKGQSVERMKKIREDLDGRGVQYEYRETTYAGEAIELARQLAETCDTVVAAGGDGTLYEVVNGTVDLDIKYGLLPFGSGNDTSRTLGLFGKTDKELVDVILGENYVDFDCEQFNDETISLQFVAMGIVPEVLANFLKKKKSRGINYVLSLLGAIIKHKPKTYKISADGEEFEALADMISVCNIQTAGGGLKICPEASTNDKALDLIMIKRTGRLRYYRNVVALARGKLMSQPNVIHKRVTEAMLIAGGVEYCVIDGEMFEFDKVKVSLYPKQIKIKC